jgi:signal transduction histidine kinase
MSNQNLIVLDEETTDKLINDCLSRHRAEERKKLNRQMEEEVIPFLEAIDEWVKNYEASKNDWRK